MCQLTSTSRTTMTNITNIAIRVCIFHLSLLMDILKDGGDPSKELLLSGHMGKLMNDFMSIGAKGHNVSLILRNSIYDCVDTLKTNASDILLTGVPIMGQDFEHVFPFCPYRDVYFTIHSAYNMSSPNSMHFADIFLSAVTGLSWGMILGSILLLLTSYGFLNLSTWIKDPERRKPRLQFGFELFAQFMQQEAVDFDDSARRLISLILSISSFFICLAIGCVLATQLVVVDEPKLISSFEDIKKNPNIKVALPDFANMEEGVHVFRPGSREWKYYQMISKRLIKISSVRANTIAQLMDHTDQMLSGQLVTLLPNMVDMKVKTFFCSTCSMAAPKMKGFTTFPYFVTPDTIPLSLTFVMSQWFRQTTPGTKYIKKIRKVMEGGHLDHLVDMFDMEYGLFPKDNYYHRCMSAMVVMPRVPNTQSVKLQNLDWLFRIVSCLVIIALDVFLLEYHWQILKKGTWKRNSRKIDHLRERPASC